MFTCRSLDEGGTRLGPCDIAVATPQHVTPASPQVPPTFRGVPRLRHEGDGCASPPAHIHQVRAGASLRGVNVGFSRMPFRHARHTRTVWQYRHAMALSGPLPPAPTPPGAGCPQLRSPAATEPRSRSLTSTRSTSASRRTGGVTHVESSQVCEDGAE